MICSSFCWRTKTARVKYITYRTLPLFVCGLLVDGFEASSFTRDREFDDCSPTWKQKRRRKYTNLWGIPWENHNNVDLYVSGFKVLHPKLPGLECTHSVYLHNRDSRIKINYDFTHFWLGCHFIFNSLYLTEEVLSIWYFKVYDDILLMHWCVSTTLDWKNPFDTIMNDFQLGNAAVHQKQHLGSLLWSADHWAFSARCETDRSKSAFIPRHRLTVTREQEQPFRIVAKGTSDTNTHQVPLARRYSTSEGSLGFIYKPVVFK